MKTTTSKEKVLKNIRNALINKSMSSYSVNDSETPIYNYSEEPLDIAFVQQFTNIGGKFVYCEDISDFALQFKELLKKNTNWVNIFCLDDNIREIFRKSNIPFSDEESDFMATNVGVTTCEFLIARLGSVMVSSKLDSGRRLIVFPDVHIVVAYSSQIVPDIKNALSGIKEKYGKYIPSTISMITGPSRTADIEKTLVLGAHGPKEIYVFLIDDSEY
ncbi:MAG: LUD domain-containing protein [Bacteroidota bacterium]|nr:LUD domain-containing protein [Bacteroidota bacterium]